MTLPIRFKVSYSLREYTSFVADHAHAAMNRSLAEGGRPPRAQLPLYVRCLVAAVASVTFVLKKGRVGDFEFIIDERCIERRAADGSVRLAWHKVSAIRPYSQGWLISQGDAAFALPYRCMTPAEVVALEDLISACQAELAQRKILMR